MVVAPRNTRLAQRRSRICDLVVSVVGRVAAPTEDAIAVGLQIMVEPMMRAWAASIRNGTVFVWFSMKAAAA